MKKIKFAAGRVEEFACEGGKSQSFLWDTASPGLGLRVTSKGAKSYIFQGKLDGATIRLTIGDPRTWDIAKAALTVKHMDWYEVTESRGHIVDGKVAHFQVTLKVGFRLE